MRDYSRIAPQFWIGTTGKELRRQGSDAQLVALYLLTSPHANMIGLYYLPKLYLSHETGMTMEGASKGLQRAIEAGFCEYDETTEMIWVPEMASHQVGETLSANDKRVVGIKRQYAELPENPFLQAFFDKYADAFHLTESRGASKPLRRGIKGPPKSGAGTGTGTGTRAGSPSAPAEPAWIDEFKSVYPKRAGANPWHRAVQAANARLAEGHDPAEFIEGARRYAEFVRVSGKERTEFVQQAATFLGPSKPFLEPWTAPASKADIRLVSNLNAAEEFMRRTEPSNAA